MSKRKPLEPTDIVFLAAETRQQPMHVGSLLLYKAKEGESADELATRNFEHMLTFTEATAPFNYRLQRRWLPYWEEDSEFDVTNHVRHVNLPYPGEIKDLLAMVGVFHGLTMDRSLPLWYVWIISGLPDNRYAVYMQIHHSLVDGVAGARMISRSHSTDPEQRDIPPFWAMPVEDKKSKRAKKGNDEQDLVMDPLSATVDLLRSNRNILLSLRQAWKNDRVSALQSNLFNAPKTILNQPITGSRRFVADSVSLSRIKAEGKRRDATVNDMLMAMIGRALQHYLRDLGELPSNSLRAMMPVNLREEGEVGGNQVAMVRADMGTQFDDINKLIAATQASVNSQKKLLKSLSKGEKQLYTAISLAPWLSNVATGKMESFRTANTLLSNVPGPKQTLYWNGLELDAMYPVSIPLHQMAINFTVFSYRDNIELGIIACRSKIPHMQKLLRYVHQALDELENAALPE